MSYPRFVRAAGAVLVAGIVAAPAFGQEAARPPVVKHDLQGRDNCMMCHRIGVMEAVPDVPASHQDRPNETCQWCHAPDAAMQTKTPKAMSHGPEGRDQCMMCHRAGAMEPVPDAPADHEGRDVKYCTLCHTPPESN
ncbi:MAG: hypothetical protein GTN62_00950 [Gemmatimonadales bacterium]|nr:hypothetical protein [Gemmatimonadales bacterium]NIN48671.1 hypothetical protein [Gemmatimonadales bacterium]NIP06135.1 hypothetical protein [Gemmatimonadales bacterium]NIR01309.1 hypothetical protein [Gemmatimonadales bacterium]